MKNRVRMLILQAKIVPPAKMTTNQRILILLPTAKTMIVLLKAHLIVMKALANHGVISKKKPLELIVTKKKMKMFVPIPINVPMASRVVLHLSEESKHCYLLNFSNTFVL